MDTLIEDNIFCIFDLLDDKSIILYSQTNKNNKTLVDRYALQKMKNPFVELVLSNMYKNLSKQNGSANKCSSCDNIFFINYKKNMKCYFCNKFTCEDCGIHYTNCLNFICLECNIKCVKCKQSILNEFLCPDKNCVECTESYCLNCHEIGTCHLIS
jgi:hypothetical protein